MESAVIKKEIYEALRKIQAKDFSGAETLLKDSLSQSEALKDKTEQALIYSTWGVMEKVREDYKAAWRYYEKAEKLLPDDPSLKIIMANFLIDQFAQYDVAIKKMKAVLDLTKGAPSFEHQAYATMAIAYLRKGDRKKALEFLGKSMKGDFEGISSAQNINLNVVEAFLARNFEPALCQSYLEKALKLAKSKREDALISLFNKLLSNFHKIQEVVIQ